MISVDSREKHRASPLVNVPSPGLRKCIAMRAVQSAANSAEGVKAAHALVRLFHRSVRPSTCRVLEKWLEFEGERLGLWVLKAVDLMLVKLLDVETSRFLTEKAAICGR